MNCIDCIHWKPKGDLSNSIEFIDNVYLTIRRGICSNKAMNDSVNLYVDDLGYQKAKIEFDKNYWPPSFDGTSRITPSILFRWETTEDFGCVLHNK